jgi:hypothetical protein
MKWILAIGVMIMALSCSVDKNLMNKQEFSEWSNRNDTIFHKEVAIGRYDATMNEWELYRGKQTMEITIYCLDYTGDVQGLINYVHTKHPKNKVEIKANPRNR